MDFDGFLWISMDFDGLVDFYECLMDFCGFVKKHGDFAGFDWLKLVISWDLTN